MALQPGTRFGSYEIGESIGSGGMGEVYRAHDTTLERDVAIKVLPASFAEDANRVARFEQEAKTLASLNHPNIAHIYGLERSDGTTALVMELVEGPTLADRIAEAPLPADEALGIAMQIADALEAAHGQNIVHRDLKPANIKLRPDGLIKVLDFGIAKALAPENLTSGPASPIMTTPATQVGVILGTAAYMSPEQAKGKAVDQRTDIWAFGCVLYEMLTGQLAFGAEDVPTTLARVIANDTNFDTLPATVSPAVRHTMRLCLQKDVRKRVRDIGDVKLALEGEFESRLPQAADGAAVVPSAWARPLPVAAATLITTAVVAALVAWTQWPGPGPQPVNRFDYDLSGGQSFRETNRRVLTISPDGRYFAYNANDGLYLRAMGDLVAHPIPGTETTSSAPTFSPDGQSLVYWDDVAGDLKRVAISGGATAVVAAPSNSPAALSWASDDTILFSRFDEGIYRVPASGGTPELVVEVTTPGEEIYGGRLLPDGDSVLFTISRNGADPETVVQSLTTGARKVLVPGGRDARYMPTGHLVYAVGDELFGVAFDLDRLSVSGGAVPVLQGVRPALGANNLQPNSESNYSVADDGTLVYLPGSVVSGARRLVWVDRAGREEQINTRPDVYSYPRISPDGSALAVDVRGGSRDIWTFSFARGTFSRLTFDPEYDRWPSWSSDGRRVAFSSTRDTKQTNVTSLYWRAADGSGSDERIVEGSGQIFPVSFAPDGSGILVSGAIAGGGQNDDIAFLPLEGDKQLVPLLQTSFVERNPELSPDSRWLAYSSDESGREEVYVRPFPDVQSGRWQVSTDGGVQPLWSRDGQELFYRDGESMLSVPVETGSTFSAGNPRILFKDTYVLGQGGRSYDASLDGTRFVMVGELEATVAPTQIIVVQNWFEELKRLVPTE